MRKGREERKNEQANHRILSGRNRRQGSKAHRLNANLCHMNLMLWAQDQGNDLTRRVFEGDYSSS